MKIGIFGGSFDPAHLGHLFMTKTAFDLMGLDKCIIVPSYLNPFKSSNTATPNQRLDMCRLNFENEDEYDFVVSDFEVGRAGKSYTYDTLCHFKELYPNDELFLMVGSDLIFEFDRWYRSSELLKMAELICISRERNTKRSDVERYARDVLKCENQVHFIEIEPFVISSTQIREKIKSGDSTADFLKESVKKYIDEANLYGK